MSQTPDRAPEETQAVPAGGRGPPAHPTLGAPMRFLGPAVRNRQELRAAPSLRQEDSGAGHPVR